MNVAEGAIQQEIYIWVNNNYCLVGMQPRFVIFAVPNGGKRDLREAAYLKKTGVLAGVSDLIIVGDSWVLFIEVKDATGPQSDKQRDFESRVQSLGFEYWVVRSLSEFKIKFKKYLDGK